MGFIEFVSLGVSSVVMIILSKTRLHSRTNCFSCSYNEHAIDLSQKQDEQDNNRIDEEDEEEEEERISSIRTLPPPPAPTMRPLPVCHNLNRL
jgi:hypothetical protein